MAAEIAEQPTAIRRLLDRRHAICRVAAAIARADVRFVVLAARGSSDHAALYGKYLVEVRLGLPAGLASPSTMTAYGAAVDLRNVLWVSISQSGSSPDLVESTQAARSRGALTLALTNTPDSDLASVSELAVDVAAGPELAVAATKSYTNQLLAMLILMNAWSGPHEAGLADLTGLAELAERTLAEPVPQHLIDRLDQASTLTLVGRGFSYPTAREAALKLMETTGIIAQAYSGADLLHGPVAALRPAAAVIAVLGEGAGRRAMSEVLAVLGRRGTDLVRLGSGLAAGPDRLRIPRTAEESVSTILQTLPLQQLARLLAVRRGLDPDRPVGLVKATRTR